MRMAFRADIALVLVRAGCPIDYPGPESPALTTPFHHRAYDRLRPPHVSFASRLCHGSVPVIRWNWRAGQWSKPKEVGPGCTRGGHLGVMNPPGGSSRWTPSTRSPAWHHTTQGLTTVQPSAPTPTR